MTLRQKNEIDPAPRIAITIGDPAGIGVEVTLKALADPSLWEMARYIVVGEAWLLEEAMQTMGIRLNLPALGSQQEIAGWNASCIWDVGALLREDYVLGKLSAACGAASLAYIRAATHLCLEGATDAMTTAPVNKEAAALSGVAFTGHTEYIGDLCGVADTRMLLANDALRVVHVTTHCALRAACESSSERILQTIELGWEATKRLGRPEPRIAVCGLNPHAGEHGLFGTEDAEKIAPAVQEARRRGIHCDGPIPADTLFFRAVRGEYDLVVAMYHDQGHIPMKLLDFENTVNISLGLPIIRTSVDHGTAFDLAGKNLASPDSMKAALRYAATMAKNRISEK